MRGLLNGADELYETLVDWVRHPAQYRRASAAVIAEAIELLEATG